MDADLARRRGPLRLPPACASTWRARAGTLDAPTTAALPPHRSQRWEEGWVEFLDKKQAKLAAALLNNQAIGALAGTARGRCAR